MFSKVNDDNKLYNPLLKNISKSSNVLFNTIEKVKSELMLLKGCGNRNSLEQKMYKHLCYMFELAYALSIDHAKNISCNAGCEWQLQYYGM